MSVAAVMPEQVWVCNICGDISVMKNNMSGRACLHGCRGGFIVGWIVDGTVLLDDEILQKEKSEPECC